MITIELASNGYIVKHKVDDRLDSFVVEQKEGVSDAQVFKKLVHILEDITGCIGSKRDDERFYAVVAPGYSNPNYKGLDFAFWGEYYTVDSGDTSQ